MSKVALITGGASGMGLAVATALSKRGNWTVHLVDLNETAGKEAVSSLPNSHFHRTDVTSYSSLGATFETAFKTAGRLDFVFANAGIVERDNFYEIQQSQGTSPPNPPNQLSIDINLKAVVNTSFLALHYFRLSPHKGKGASLVMTASCGGLYPSQFCPMYSAAKAGVVQFMRSIAFPYHHNDGVRCYAICPGTVRTNLLSGEEWKSFPDSYFTPIETIVSTVEKLIDGGAIQDAVGKGVESGADYGLAVEINGKNFYFRDQIPYCDDAMRAVMEATRMENQLERIEKGKREMKGKVDPA
ncbi:3-beta-hydroxysteroid dehydrogenase [Patellaria atrata CBS 101060]|uniref:3-beta-hydroxysteroid dehydrogenase n=1 Tax=Patellaria atrata CBS 101060 TaxID=1346257 RepID=A0A9P4VSD7_9PEZI|nr:3-beta-hydroxysteroid dehydrogenase [Patellaria atrata CBS 101060]